MAAALTVKTIETMRPGATRREVPDGLVRGLFFIIQASPSAARSWAVRYRNSDGRTRKLTLGGFPALDLKAARGRAREVLLVVAEGADPASAKHAAKAEAAAERDLVERVANEFVQRYCKPKNRSWEETARLLDREVVTPWRGRHLAAITRADVNELLDGVVDRGSGIAANRLLAALRRMCGWAIERGLIETSPCDRVRAPTAERSRDRLLTDEELRAFWRATESLPGPQAGFLRVLALTGQRRSEVAEMNWGEIDLDAAVWVLPASRSKNGAGHTVPLSGPVLSILKALPRIEAMGVKNSPLFTFDGRRPINGFSALKRRVDKAMNESLGEPAPDWRFHDLRRGAASGMARLGVALPTIEKVLNHASGSFAGIVSTYNRHGYAGEMRDALDRWAAFVERLVSDPGANVVSLQARAS